MLRSLRKTFFLAILMSVAGSVALAQSTPVAGYRERSVKFLYFDKENMNRMFLERASGLRLPLVFQDTEVACYIANNVKDEFYIEYDVIDEEVAVGEVKRVSVLRRIESMKTGKKLDAWKKQEEEDPSLAETRHKKLQEVREFGDYRK